jgi:hypothetical protein
MEKCRCRLLQLQSPQRRPAARRGPHVADTHALSAKRKRSPPKWPPLSAQLFARKLARLFVLGFGARTLRGLKAPVHLTGAASRFDSVIIGAADIVIFQGQ